MSRIYIAIFLTLISVISHSNFLIELDIFHSCAPRVDGQLYCWGYDQDSNGNAVDTPSLVDFNIYQLGENFGCMLKEQSVSCWGNNIDGQTNAPNLSVVTGLAVGSTHACAISEGSKINCWGENTNSKLNAPSLVAPTSIVSDYHHTCAIDGNKVACWGKNNEGQATDKILSNPSKVVTGYSTTCAIDDVGLTCWGEYAQNINGNILDVGLGYDHGCALVDENNQRSVECWGENRYGQLNIPTYSNPSMLTVGRSHNCIVDSNRAACWGRKTGWEKAETDYTYTNIITIESGNDHTCTKSDEGIQCWGRNNRGQASIPDKDGDGRNDLIDYFPNNADEWLDTDNDGVGNNSDVYPNDPAEWADIDGDGVGDNTDAFPRDPNESIDSDGDGVGDNTDPYPNDPTRWGDRDNDGVSNDLDAFPDDRAASVDTDGDGFPDQWNVSCSQQCISQSNLILDQVPANPNFWYPEEYVDFGQKIFHITETAITPHRLAVGFLVLKKEKIYTTLEKFGVDDWICAIISEDYFEYDEYVEFTKSNLPSLTANIFHNELEFSHSHLMMQLRDRFKVSLSEPPVEFACQLYKNNKRYSFYSVFVTDEVSRLRVSKGTNIE